MLMDVARLLTNHAQYAYIGVSLNELSGLVLTCSPSERLAATAAGAVGSCPVATGEDTLKQLGMAGYSVGGCARWKI